MSTVTLPTAEDITLAVEDSDFYADTIAHLDEDAKARFAAEVRAAYNATRAPATLTGTDHRVLKFADRIGQREFRTAGHCEQAIRDEFGYSATRYYQALNALLDRPEAARAYPVLVGRLRALRETRRAARRSTRNQAVGSAA